VLAILLCFRNQEVQFATAGIPIELGVPALLLEGVNAVGDRGKLTLAQSLSSLLDLLNAHIASWYRLWVAGSCTAKWTWLDGEPNARMVLVTFRA